MGSADTDNASDGSGAADANRGRTATFPHCKTRHLRKTISVLSRRPGLESLAAILDLPETSPLRTLSSVRIAARLDCGTLLAQTVRASPCFLSKPWYGAVLYDEADAVGSDVMGDEASRVLVFGEVRLIIRRGDQDVAIVCNWQETPAVSECPLTARHCTRLRWADAPAGDGWSLSVVPVSRIRRVVEIVPDFEHVTRTRGMTAFPRGRDASASQLREMRYFVNEFYPWA